RRSAAPSALTGGLSMVATATKPWRAIRTVCIGWLLGLGLNSAKRNILAQTAQLGSGSARHCQAPIIEPGRRALMHSASQNYCRQRLTARDRSNIVGPSRPTATPA